MSLSPIQLLIILGIAILIFGTSKLKNAGKDLGGAVKGFKDAVKDEEEAHAKAKNQPKVLDHEATDHTEIKPNVDKVKTEDTHQS